MKLKSLMTAAALSAAAFASHGKSAKHITILVTGGTIAGSAETQTQAGYTSGSIRGQRVFCRGNWGNYHGWT